jgi:hypothetical protein
MTSEYQLRPEPNSVLATWDALRVRGQLDKILASHPFAQSKRYPALLRYIVEHTLRGQAHLLKERTIGVEVFGRPLHYETSEDPIVRVSAAEIRKRLAQYYQEPSHQGEPRIELRVGSYTPDFYFIEQVPVPDDSPEHGSAGSHVSDATPRPVPTSRGARSATIWILSAAAVLVVAAFVLAYLSRQDGKLRLVWRSVLESPSPIVISIIEQVPDRLQGTTNAGSESLTAHQHQDMVNSIHFSDVQALANIISFLENHHHLYRLQTAQATTYADLRQGPAILIGAYDNPWTMRAIQPLRYCFGRDDQHQLFWIEDQKNRQSKKWTVDLSRPYSTLNQDFAVVASFVDPETRQPLVVIAGIGENGTRAASEFLTGSENVRDVDYSLLPTKANFEIVVQTQVINGVSGPPQIVATETW